MSQRSLSPNRQMQFRLRTLAIATAVGPVLLALLWYLGIWLSNALPDLLLQWNLTLGWLSMMLGFVLAIVSVGWPPSSDDECRASRGAALAIAVAVFVVLWAVFWPSFEVLGWLLIWGDNESHRERYWVWLWSLIAAGFVAGNIAVRGILALITRRHALTVALLAAATLIVVAPLYLRWWLR